MGLLLRSSIVLLLSSLPMAYAGATAQKEVRPSEAALQLEHQDPQWLDVKPHLPDPTTATAEQLETAADVLRARRFPETAVDYYTYAIRRGGETTQLLNKIGVTELELQRPVVARAYFQRAVRLGKKDPEGWNNLGAVEYLDRQYGSAISDYHRAIKLDKMAAIYHSNLATALFEKRDFDDARKEYDIALRLDPKMLERHGSAGVTTRMLSPEDHARFCFELARLYAHRGDETNMLHFLTTASEGGFDVLAAMGSDPVLAPYRKDPRVLLLVRNAKALRSGHMSIAEASGAAPPPLPPALHQ